MLSVSRAPTATPMSPGGARLTLSHCGSRRLIPGLRRLRALLPGSTSAAPPKRLGGYARSSSRQPVSPGRMHRGASLQVAANHLYNESPTSPAPNVGLPPREQPPATRYAAQCRAASRSSRSRDAPRPKRPQPRRPRRVAPKAARGAPEGGPPLKGARSRRRVGVDAAKENRSASAELPTATPIPPEELG